MSNYTKKEFIINSYANRPFLVDISFENNNQKKPIILFVHGFKGFKDWGFFNLMSQWFTEHNFFFIKLNFSHNGTTTKSPLDFADLDAFGNNNFSKELLDLESMFDHIFSKENASLYQQADINNITLLGHSKGGATAIIKAYEDIRITRLATLAAVLDIKSRYADRENTTWKEKGVLHIHNSRTNQEMPLYYQLAEDVLTNQPRFNIAKLLHTFNKRALFIHPKQDETVPIEELSIVKTINNKNILIKEVKGSHTFDGHHPYTSDILPQNATTAFELIKEFIKNDSN